MATTPHADPPKHKTHDDKEPEAKAHAAPKEAAPKYPTVTNAWSLFSNGHRIAKQGDDKYKWISQSRAADGVTIVTSPMTPEIEQAVRTGEYYLVEDQESYTVPPPVAPAAGGPPTNRDVPYVSASGAQANCTMGNWDGEPTSYAYAWQRDGSLIPGPVGPDYTMVAADAGKAIGCIVTATNAAGSTTAPISNTVTGPSAK